MTGDSRARVAVFGAGAVGAYFGGMLARAGAPVTLIGRSPHVDAMRRDGLMLETVRFRERVRIDASSDAAAARGADVVLLCVKTVDTESAARALAPHAGGAVVVSLQNGVDNAERARAAAGLEVVPAVVYVAAEMAGPGHVKQTGRGDLVVGAPAGDGAPADARRARVDAMAAAFEHAGVPCRVARDVEGELWTKLALNCAYNAVSALTRARYGRIAASPHAREIQRRVIEEAVAVARSAGARLPDVDLLELGTKLGAGIPEAISSTAQDLARGKRTEIDSLNGYVARRGAELGVATPVNAMLHALVKLVEEAASAERRANE